jgi:FlaA1/EpsC-like NDP-sugar epimerase
VPYLAYTVADYPAGLVSGTYRSLADQGKSIVRTRRLVVVAVHIGLWIASFALAFALRFDFAWPSYPLAIPVWLPVLLAARVGIFLAFGLFRGLWRYTGSRDLMAILFATTLSTVAFVIAVTSGLGPIPRSIPIIEWLGAIVLVGGMRFASRAIWTAVRSDVASDLEQRRILIVGAGDAGEMLLREIQKNQRARYDIVGFLDDDPAKRGAQIHGVRVFGEIGLLPSKVIRRKVDEVIIAIPTANGAQMRRIVDLCKAAGVRFRTIPGLDHLIDGRVTVNQVRDVAIEDLLGRAPVQLDMTAISALMEGHVVMVTGAGGSIGSEICRQVCRFSPGKLILVERTENNLFQIHRELLASDPEVPLEPCVADVSDKARMRELFDAQRPTVVFHAAAHKHVPMMEWNPGEAVKNNVFGTKTLADLADRFAVERFVMISTDKAVNPTSVMGVSKRVAEIYVQALSQRSKTKFVTVRFGNVLGSAGSVIPIFKEQIANGGPVTVTHPDMTRYFMTIPEASQLVLQAGTMGAGGEIFILDMGAPVKIADLARDLITLSGLTPDQDVEIRYTGIRPGEKLFEELSVDAESAARTRHPKIFVGRFRPHAWEQVQRQLVELGAIADERTNEVRAKFAEIVPEYRPQSPKGAPLAVPALTALRAAND